MHSLGSLAIIFSLSSNLNVEALSVAEMKAKTMDAAKKSSLFFGEYTHLIEAIDQVELQSRNMMAQFSAVQDDVRMLKQLFNNHVAKLKGGAPPPPINNSSLTYNATSGWADMRSTRVYELWFVTKILQVFFQD